jgi:hypothetical protein
VQATSMDSSIQKQDVKNSKAHKLKPVLKKLDPAAGKILSTLSEKANKKERGRKIRDGEILALGLKLIKDEHIKQLQEESLSEKDRLAEAYEKYQKNHGKLSMDQFIGKLLKGEINEKSLGA